MKIPVELQGVLVSTSDTLHGAARFVGTRVFAQSLFDYVLAGEKLEVFLEHFPDVSRDQAEKVLEWERRRLSTDYGFAKSA